MPRLRSQVFQDLVCRALFGIFLGGALGPAHELGLTVIANRLQSDFNRKGFTVLRSQFFY
jgi:hypothetical protein